MRCRSAGSIRVVLLGLLPCLGCASSTLTGPLAPFLFTLPANDLGATFFLAGSTIFAYLFLRGRIVPAALAWLGLVGSLVALVVFMVGSSSRL